VHVAYEDAQGYARWAGKELPTEAEWEFSARGGLENAPYCWGDEFLPGGRRMANTWEGDFPLPALGARDVGRTSPVASYPPNGYGLYDMAGNVWEWTCDWYQARHAADPAKPCCVPVDPRGGIITQSYDSAQGPIRIPRKVLKGGSFLCAPNYCRRYRPAARQPQMIDSTASHIGFRCVVRLR
jgi:formylglycine-generating enzyme required for sulfatase activity